MSTNKRQRSGSLCQEVLMENAVKEYKCHDPYNISKKCSNFKKKLFIGGDSSHGFCMDIKVSFSIRFRL